MQDRLTPKDRLEIAVNVGIVLALLAASWFVVIIPAMFLVRTFEVFSR